MTLLSQGCILENGSSCGNGGQHISSKDREGGEEPPNAQVHFMGQSVVISSPVLPSPSLNCLLHNRPIDIERCIVGAKNSDFIQKASRSSR